MKKKVFLGVLAGLFVAVSMFHPSVTFAYNLEDLLGLAAQIQNQNPGYFSRFVPTSPRIRSASLWFSVLRLIKIVTLC